MKQEVLDLVKDTVETLDYKLVECHFEGARGRQELRVIIFHEEKISTQDCSKVASVLSRRLDIDDFIPGAYNLIVESPGVEYIFKEDLHFSLFKDKEILLTLKDFNKYGLKDPVVQGVNLGLEEDQVVVKKGEDTVRFHKDDISKCRLYFDIKKYL